MRVTDFVHGVQSVMHLLSSASPTVHNIASQLLSVLHSTPSS